MYNQKLDKIFMHTKFGVLLFIFRIRNFKDTQSKIFPLNQGNKRFRRVVLIEFYYEYYIFFVLRG